MKRLRQISAASLVALFLVGSSASAVFADHDHDHDHEHLDRHETRLIVRHLEEESIHLQDHIDHWIDEHREERSHKAEELNKHLDHFEVSVNNLRSAVLAHDEPWDVRDQAREVIESAARLRDALDHADYLPKDAWRDWANVRDRCNDLARIYHLEPVGEHK